MRRSRLSLVAAVAIGGVLLRPAAGHAESTPSASAKPAPSGKVATATLHFSKAERIAISQLSPIGPVPADPTDKVADNPMAARFGQYLYFDPTLSANHKVSCASCHQPARAFTDGRRVGIGIGKDTRNTPTLLNVAYNHWFFWGGRADSLWAQALYVMETPSEFGSDRVHIARVIYDNPALRKAYRKIFGPMPPMDDAARFPADARPVPDDPNARLSKAWAAMAPVDRQAVNRVFSNLGKTIEAYERRLVSADSPFDQFVAGLTTHDAAKRAELSPAAQDGLKLFIGAAHCDLCHSGPRFTDGQFHDLGLPVLAGEKPDIGRDAGIREVKADIFNGTGPFSDDPTGPAKAKLEFLPPPASARGKFKTPTLRNVARTAPYMHDGRFKTLTEVVSFYAKGKAGIHGRIVGKRERLLDIIPHLTSAQIHDIVAFLDSLNSKPLAHDLLVQPPSP